MCSEKLHYFAPGYLDGNVETEGIIEPVLSVFGKVAHRLMKQLKE